MAAVIQKGGNITFLADDTAFECLTQSDINLSIEELDTTCKNANNNKSFEPGAKTVEFQIGGNYTDGSTSNEDFHAFWTKAYAGTSFTGKWGGVDVGDKTYSATCYIFNLQVSAGNSGELVSWTASCKVSGAVTVATVA